MAKESVYFTLSNVDGNHDMKEIKKVLAVFPDVSSVSVNEAANHVAVDFDTTGIQSDRIQSRLEKEGYEILDIK